MVYKWPFHLNKCFKSLHVSGNIKVLNKIIFSTTLHSESYFQIFLILKRIINLYCCKTVNYLGHIYKTFCMTAFKMSKHVEIVLRLMKMTVKAIETCEFTPMECREHYVRYSDIFHNIMFYLLEILLITSSKIIL